MEVCKYCNKLQPCEELSLKLIKDKRMLNSFKMSLKLNMHLKAQYNPVC